MILLWLILIPFLGGTAAWLGERYHDAFPRWVALASTTAGLLLAATVWIGHGAALSLSAPSAPLRSLRLPWIQPLGISFYLAADGLSLLLVLLTTALGVAAVACSWTEIRNRTGAYYFTLLAVISGVTGVFLALDLFLFYFFWEVMLVPMYFLIAVWGHAGRRYAALKFFIFTQGCSLVLLTAILALYFLHGADSGVYTFDYQTLRGTALGPAAARWLMLGFFVGFAVKVPVVPLHPWLADAHTEAPTAGSVLLAGILLKTGAYGMLRFVLGLFPDAARDFAPAAATLGAAGILYGAILAFAQTDFKRLVAYTSVSHLGFVLLGIFTPNVWAIQGAVIEMVCHAFSTGALFVLAGALSARLHTRDMRKMGGLWQQAPVLSGIGLFFALASLGLPGLGNFIGEFLVLLGSWQETPIIAAIAAAGLVTAAIYSLWLVQMVFHGEYRPACSIPDLTARERATFAGMVLVLTWLGVYPTPIFTAVQGSVQSILPNFAKPVPAPSRVRISPAGPATGSHHPPAMLLEVGHDR